MNKYVYTYIYIIEYEGMYAYIYIHICMYAMCINAYAKNDQYTMHTYMSMLHAVCMLKVLHPGLSTLHQDPLSSIPFHFSPLQAHLSSSPRNVNLCQVPLYGSQSTCACTYTACKQRTPPNKIFIRAACFNSRVKDPPGQCRLSA